MQLIRIIRIVRVIIQTREVASSRAKQEGLSLDAAVLIAHELGEREAVVGAGA